MIYDLVIIGGGPAATSAAIYSARKRLQTLVIAEEIGGQSSVSNEIYNWIGTPKISGMELANSFKKHMEEYVKENHTLKLATGARVERIEKKDGVFEITKSNGEKVESRSVLITTGSRRRKLEAKGAQEFENKGVVYCATCDGPLFSGMPTVVVGGGNAALDAVLQLSQYVSHVTLIHRSEKFNADEITVEEVRKLANVDIKTSTEIVEIKGDKFVSSVVYKNKDGEMVEIPVNAVFVEIGQLPNTDFLKGFVEMDSYNKIVVNPMNQRTSVEGIWSAGDCTNGLYHQNNIAAGDAVKAIEDLYVWIKTGK